MQEDNHIFQGMRRDNHQIRQDAKFLWDAHNIRLTNRDDSTLLSITNEKGTSDSLITLEEYYVGHCVLGKYLIVFTAYDDGSDNYIFRIEKTDSGYKKTILYHNEHITEHSWNPSNPIEAIGVYETEQVQKVYWVDGINQPRVINIVKENKEYNETSFDFVSTLKLEETVSVHKLFGTGVFSPGTLQYAFTYYNKYGQESNIFYTTPINYISPIDRGGSPEEKVSNSFKIEVNSVDTNFEYLRIYSIHRTSQDAVPTVKRVTDLPITKTGENLTISFIDTGTSGDTVDPSLLLYIGGVNIIASTICAKDGTLFLGGLELKNNSDWIEIKKKVKEEFPPLWRRVAIKTNTQEVGTGKYYSYKPDLNNRGFKTYETYRCGIQLQSSTGVWSEPIFLKDSILNIRYPSTGEGSSSIWTSYRLSLTPALVEYLKKKGYVKVRTCIVYPTINDRTILCQGVLCPTVFNVGQRKSASPYAMSSWFFRPQYSPLALEAKEAVEGKTYNAYKGETIECMHNRPLYTGPNKGAEVQCTPYEPSVKTINDINSVDTQASYFFVDANLVTMHSPDIEFNPSVYEGILNDSLELNVIGGIQLGASIGDIDIRTSSPPASDSSSGFVHNFIGYQIGDTTADYSNGGLVAGGFYKDVKVLRTGGIESSLVHHMVYPWHRSGSLNNSNKIEDKARSAVLEKKKLSNLKFFDTFIKADSNPIYDIGTPQLFSSNEVSLVKVWVDYLNKEVPYYGNVDTLIPASNAYGLYTAPSFHDPMTRIGIDEQANFVSNDPVRIKYKSTPHLVFSLKSGFTKGIEILPTMMGASINGEAYTIPTWDSTVGVSTSTSEYLELCGIYGGSSTSFPAPPNTEDIGKYAWISGKGELDGAKFFIKATASNIGWSKKEAYDTLTEGTVFKIVGDGKSCILEDTFHIFGFGPKNEGEYAYYTGPTKFYKLVNSKKLPGTITGDLKEETSITDTPTVKDSFTITQRNIKNAVDNRFRPFLVLAELRRKRVDNRFGGLSEEAIRSNLWLPAGTPTRLTNVNDEQYVEIDFEYGDTWYSRYDCLKTYPFTQEDENSVVEIGSFMCETRVNIDGRYDRNRGQISNLSMSPQNFNVINEAYSQMDNFFNYRVLADEYYKSNKFSNQLTWSLEKTPSSDTDPWTNITLANTLDMDGERGRVTALRTWNEYLLCFQEKALSQILFNSRVQIPTTDGVPIEISNGYKVDGSRLLSSNIGCSNKWATIPTTTGLYFLDSNTDSLYIFNGQLTNLSEDRGMDWWVKQNHTSKVWCPIDYGRTLNGVRAFYDSRYGDVYFTPGPTLLEQPDALCYSEQLGQFTSLMSYGGTQAMFNFADGFYSLRHDSDGNLRLYQNNVGDYNDFYGTPKGWSFSFISNQNPTLTKIFDTIELRTDHYWTYGTKHLLNTCPMDYIEVDNEYQHSGTVPLNSKNMRKKFRVWRGLMPRNKGTRQRIRNPWSMITLGWTPDNTERPGNNTKKAVVHDVSVKYTV